MTFVLRALSMRFSAILFTVGLFLVTSPIQAETSLPKLTIAAGEWPPFLSASLPDEGIVAHLIKDVFMEAGYEVEFAFLPWVRAFVEASEGNYDATAVWMFKEDRTVDFHYSAPVLNEEFVLFHKSNKPFKWTSYDDLKGLVIGGGIGYSYGPQFDAAQEEGVFRLLRLESVEQNLKMLAADRIDLYAEEKSIAYFNLQNTVPELADQITHHPNSILINQSFLLFPKISMESEALMEAFNQALERFRNEGRYDSYFSSE